MPSDRGAFRTAGRLLFAWRDRHQGKAARLGGRALATQPVIATPDDWRAAVDFLSAADPVLARLIATLPAPQPRWRDAEPFPALVSAIISQQLSGKVAAAIEARVMALIGVDGAADPERLLRSSEQDLRSAGLSRPKIGFMKGLAENQMSGEIPNNAVLRGWSDQAIVDCLTRHKGVGRWTVDMYLIFHLHRADIFPNLDLGIRRAVARLHDLGETPSPDAVMPYGDAWRPYRSVACLYLWKSLELP